MSRSYAALAVSGCLLLVLSACGSVHVDAPPGGRVRLMDVDGPAAVREERTVWYALWGGQPLSDVSTAGAIERHKLREVRASTEATPLDSIVSAFTAILTISRRTFVIEGNP